MINQKTRIFYLTHSNLKDLSFGDSINDNKFINSIPSHFKIFKMFPIRNQKQMISHIELMKFILRITIASLRLKQIFIIRGTKPSFIPFLFQKIFKHKIILNLGCTPFYTIERREFLKNPEYNFKFNKIRKFILKLEFQFEKYFLRNANEILVENEKAKKLVTLYGANNSKIQILRYYVQNYFLTSKKIKYNYGNVFKLGYTGRFHKYDCLLTLIDAIKILKENNYSIKLYLIGDGPTKEEIEYKIKKLNLNENVTLLGSQSHKNVSRIIDKLHCLILPMVKKICPSSIAIKILEGIMKGKIIITTNSGNNKSLFTPFYDLILEKINPSELAYKIVEVMKNYNKYLLLAEKIRQKQLKIRSFKIFNRKLMKILNQYIDK